MAHGRTGIHDYVITYESLGIDNGSRANIAAHAQPGRGINPGSGMDKCCPTDVLERPGRSRPIFIILESQKGRNIIKVGKKAQRSSNGNAFD
jgi:hypothetical protein